MCFQVRSISTSLAVVLVLGRRGEMGTCQRQGVLARPPAAHPGQPHIPQGLGWPLAWSPRFPTPQVLKREGLGRLGSLALPSARRVCAQLSVSHWSPSWLCDLPLARFTYFVHQTPLNGRSTTCPNNNSQWCFLGVHHGHMQCWHVVYTVPTQPSEDLARQSVPS